MWLLFDGGFVSIVAHRDRPGHLLVRARVRSDLEAFRSIAKSRARVLETPDADYRFRATMPADAVAQAVAEIASRIDYPNFKDAVAARQGKARAGVYGDVWADLFRLQGRNEEHAP